jgi:hypothetical protein
LDRVFAGTATTALLEEVNGLAGTLAVQRALPDDVWPPGLC